MKRILTITILLFTIHHMASAQGCVAIRNNGGTCTMMGYHYDADHKAPAPSSWTFAMNSRYFKSYKHFVGTEEQKERVEKGTEVINHSFSTELSLVRQLNSRWSLAFYAPIISNARSSKYEHYGNNSESPNARRSTHAFGLGDVRLAAYYWLIDPAKMSKGNIQIGAGIKLPTGDYRYQDYFWKNDSSKFLGPVDQSIQLGDGGTGFTLETNAFLNLSHSTALYFNGFYLFNPREQNGVSATRGITPTAQQLAYGTDVMSVPDQFMFRVGAAYTVNRFNFSGGMRIEGVPAKDIIGGSNGFRRPGFVLSAEPVAAYKAKAATFYVSVPVAVERDRIQSVPDKIKTRLTGVYSQGDAAFADYTVNVGVAFPLR
jgi:hypothetical protein